MATLKTQLTVLAGAQRKAVRVFRATSQHPALRWLARAKWLRVVKEQPVSTRATPFPPQQSTGSDVQKPGLLTH